MNDTERELKELLENKASEARIAPVAPPAVLKRGRRRQLGTAFIAAGTTLVVVVGSILGVQGLLRDKGATGRPASTQPATTRTALIQGLTVTSPSDWTLIDEWPASALIAVKSSSSTFSAVGCPIEAGSGNSSGSTTCPNTTTAAPQTSPTPVPSGLPVFQLSNFDPGLTRSLCGDSVLQGNQVSLYVGLVTGPVAVAAPSSEGSFDVSSPPEDGPCGRGSYATVSTGDAVYLAFAEFGADVSDADRQQVLDTFNGLSPVPPVIGLPKITTPGYVVAGGTSVSGEAWRIEVRPSEEQSSPDPLEMTLVHGDGVKSEFITFGDVSTESIAWGNTGGMWYGAVPGDTTSLEFQPNGGGDPIPAQLFEIPSSLNGSALGFVLEVSGNVEGQLVGTTPTSGFAVGSAVAVAPSTPTPSPTQTIYEDTGAQRQLQTAVVAALWYAGPDGGSFATFDASIATKLEPSVAFNDAAHASPNTVSIRDTGPNRILLVIGTVNGDVFCVALDGSTVSYGTTDASSISECGGELDAWSTALDGSLPPVADPILTHPGTPPWVLLEGSLSDGTLCAALVPFPAVNEGLAPQICLSSDADLSQPNLMGPAFETTPGMSFLLVEAPLSVDQVVATSPDGVVSRGLSSNPPDAQNVRIWVVPLAGGPAGTLSFLNFRSQEVFPPQDFAASTAASESP